MMHHTRLTVKKARSLHGKCVAWLEAEGVKWRVQTDNREDDVCRDRTLRLDEEIDVKHLLFYTTKEGLDTPTLHPCARRYLLNLEKKYDFPPPDKLDGYSPLNILTKSEGFLCEKYMREMRARQPRQRLHGDLLYFFRKYRPSRRADADESGETDEMHVTTDEPSALSCNDGCECSTVGRKRAGACAATCWGCRWVKAIGKRHSELNLRIMKGEAWETARSRKEWRDLPVLVRKPCSAS